MKRIILIGLMTVAESAFAAKPKPPPSVDEAVRAAEIKLVIAAKNIVLAGLKDPDSAKFREVGIAPNGRAVCGQFNAKNGYGGYIGYKRFIAAPNGVFGIEDDGSMLIEANWDVVCKGDLPSGSPK
jgi:hypothetical protein